MGIKSLNIYIYFRRLEQKLSSLSTFSTHVIFVYKDNKDFQAHKLILNMSNSEKFIYFDMGYYNNNGLCLDKHPATDRKGDNYDN